MTVLQYSYNGVSVGDGTDTEVIEVEGLDLPAMRTSDVVLPGAHGGLPGIDLLDERTVTFKLELWRATTADMYAALHAFAQAMGPRNDELPLSFQLDASLPVMRVNCRPRRRNVPLTMNHIYAGAVPIDLELVASDPLIYSDVEYDINVMPPSAAGGWSYSYSYPFNYGTGGQGGSGTVTNLGTAPAPWVATVTGPCNGVAITANGSTIWWDGVLAVGETLVFDSHPARRTVEVNGTSSRFTQVRPTSDWFDLMPGTNQVYFSTNDLNGSMHFDWRHAWWSAT